MSIGGLIIALVEAINTLVEVVSIVYYALRALIVVVARTAISKVAFVQQIVQMDNSY